MKSIKYILAISLAFVLSMPYLSACGPYFPDDPMHIKMFRSCSPELEKQWQEGCRFQDFEKQENCELWQRITLPSIPLIDIERIVYNAKLNELKNLADSAYINNKFAQWLLSPNHKDDLYYLLVAKEIEEIREYMNDPWYYPYDGDEEHLRLEELVKVCEEYNEERHADRYALQTIRLCFAKGDFQKCIDLWERKLEKMPQNIVTDMIASYVGGAYSRKGNRDRAIQLFTRSQDIGSLMSLKAWDNTERKSRYSDSRIKELEYIFNRFPNSPLLSVKLQEYIRDREAFVYDYEDWKQRGFHDPVNVKTYWAGDSLVADDEHEFYDELKLFAKIALSTHDCNQKGMWDYALAYLYYLDGNKRATENYLSKAESATTTPFIKESIRAFRFLVDANKANNTSAYRAKLFNHLKWLDECMLRDADATSDYRWQYNNKMNWPVCYWQDVARKVLLGETCPRMQKAGDVALALQLANYASNRIYQIEPLYEAHHYGWNDENDPESYTQIIPFEDYRKYWTGSNWFDYCNQFFEWIDRASGEDAAKYATLITAPQNDLDKFLNERSYIDTDYIYDIVGTLYLREMNYDKAVMWLSKVSTDYQERTNIAKDGYFKLDPFRYQGDKKQFIADTSDYKLKFAQEMLQLDKLIHSSAEANRRANAKIRYATGLRNSFGRCWYLTQYGYSLNGFSTDDDFRDWQWFTSSEREGYKDNEYAQKAYDIVDTLMSQALSEFTDPEQAAQAQLEMKNYKTVVTAYPNSAAARYVRGRCDNYYDYALQKQ